MPIPERLNPTFITARQPDSLEEARRRLIVAAEKTGDRFAGFDHESELAVIVPGIGLAAECQR